MYLRLPDDGTLDAIPEDVLAECCQLVKHNSIQGCKAATVDIVYTMWGNLKKTNSMEVGQVGFHKQKEVRKVTAVAKTSDTLKRINKTQEEKHPDLEAQRKEYDHRVAKETKRKLQVCFAAAATSNDRLTCSLRDITHLTLTSDHTSQVKEVIITIWSLHMCTHSISPCTSAGNPVWVPTRCMCSSRQSRHALHEQRMLCMVEGKHELPITFDTTCRNRSRRSRSRKKRQGKKLNSAAMRT